MPVAGTSCSSPMFAGVVGLLNDQRLAAGKGTLGFINPLLYSSLVRFHRVQMDAVPVHPQPPNRRRCH